MGEGIGEGQRLWADKATERLEDRVTRLQALTAGRSVVCQEKDRDRYGRIVAICRASGEDLGAIMVREGFAWAFTRFSVDYVDQQEEARTANRGVHEMTAYQRGSGGRSGGPGAAQFSEWFATRTAASA